MNETLAEQLRRLPVQPDIQGESQRQHEREQHGPGLASRGPRCRGCGRHLEPGERYVRGLCEACDCQRGLGE